MGATEELARFVVETTYERLPEEAIHEAKRCTLETVANNLLGSASSLGKRIALQLNKGKEPPEAMLMGIGSKRSLRTAAFFNSAIADINDSMAEETVQQARKNNSEIHYIRTDVSKISDLDKMVAETVQVFGKLNIFWHNAGITGPGAIEQTTEAEFDKTMAIHLKGASYCNRCTENGLFSRL